MDEVLNIIKNDPWLEPYKDAITGRHQHVIDKEKELVGKKTLSDFATGHLYFGLHHTDKGWTFREWAPNATAIYLIGDFNEWKELPKFKLKKVKNSGNWEINLPEKAMKHGDLYKLKVYWEGGCGERIPAWATRVVQDDNTKIVSAQVWNPAKPYKFKKKVFTPNVGPLMIYECHIGMAQDAEKVGTYNEFRENILPRVVKDGYNCIQIMAIQEHPYYGSFGYHVSSFFAPSSRFGTPDELKQLIDTAHQMGLAVIMDIVHSHAVKNEMEGLGNFAGDPCQYFYQGDRREHPAWDSLCFDYGKNEVIHFLLSNCKYWLEEFHFDGFRFDGVTSMLYYSHGLGEAFCSYEDYFNGHQDDNAICYLTLANKLIHQVNPRAITIAEEVSGMPGLAAPFADGGYGFDYRMAMNVPDYWIKIIKERKDEDWKPSSMFWEVTNRRKDEKTISYCESHDQALVGDKTIIFRLIDADMYWHFRKGDENGVAERGIALHKMIRSIPKPVIAMVNGYAIGGGNVLNVVCDLSIASENARFGQTGPKVGSFDGGFGSSYLARCVGQKKTREIWYLCRQYTAKEAEEMGMINKVVPFDRLEDETVEWCETIMKRSPFAIRMIKHCLNAELDGQRGLMELAGDATLMYYLMDEAQEGKNAFLEKRDPDFEQFPKFPG